uniref:SFRICE_014279 n=1 Tax=Spodoptera frugiperda TaxID=7108 RepID=A0A2H1WPF5_SPOFR
METSWTIVKSNVGNPILVVGKYRYCLQKSRSDAKKQRWRCSSQHIRCKATAITVDETVLTRLGDHNH